MDGTNLAAIYSYWPNKLRYCGPANANKTFLDYVRYKKGKRDVIKNLKSFEAVYPYLQLIGKKNNLRPFDYKVVEAYWLGNNLLKRISKRDLRNHIMALTKRGLLRSIAERLAEKLPTGMLPNHLFHVMYVGVGSMTRRVKTTLRNIDNCRISYGKVKEIKIGKLVVKHRQLIRKSSKFDFAPPKRKVIDYNKFFLQKIKLNDTVAIHWNFAVQILNPQQLENLKNYTLHNINILNKSL